MNLFTNDIVDASELHDCCSVHSVEMGSRAWQVTLSLPVLWRSMRGKIRLSLLLIALTLVVNHALRTLVRRFVIVHGQFHMLLTLLFVRLLLLAHIPSHLRILRAMWLELLIQYVKSWANLARFTIGLRLLHPLCYFFVVDNAPITNFICFSTILL